MIFIPPKYKIDGLHSRGTTGQKRKQDIRTDGRTAPTEYNTPPVPLAGDIKKYSIYVMNQMGRKLHIQKYQA